MKINTHLKTDIELCGTPLHAAQGSSRVRLQLTDRMVVDDKNLVHGGFIFGLADYAAMIAVNHPNVVLGSAAVKFLKPVQSGQVVVAEAKVQRVEKRKHLVQVTIRLDKEAVFEGEFACFVLERPVLG